MKWFRRCVWFVAVGGWLAAILAGLVTTATPGEVVACCIMAVLTWVGIHAAFVWTWGVRRRIRRHIGVSPKDASLLQHPLTARKRIDVIRGLFASSRDQDESDCFGLSTGYLSFLTRLGGSAEPEKLEWESCQTDEQTWEEIPSNAVFLLRHDGIPFVAAVTKEIAFVHRDKDIDEVGEGSSTSGDLLRLEIVAATREQGHVVRDFLLSLAARHSVYRLRKVVVRAGERRNEAVRLDFTSLTPVPRERIVLPEQIFETVHRAAMKQLDLEDLLERAGHRTRTALLLHGPPGTGKTLLLKHLVGTRSDVTTIMLHGFRRGLVREAFRLARYCQPSIVLIEDIDLIAVRRQRNTRGATQLHELLDELDGLAPESRTVVLMTTNRPDVLEPALASRPGRISQAIEVPLPDAECRLRTLKLFTANLDVSGVDFASWVKRTEGASPAFLEELIRRAILFSVERAETTSGVSSLFVDKSRLTAVAEQDLSAAMTEILTSGGRLTQRLLGYSTGNTN